MKIKTLKDYVYEYISKGIQEGTLKPNDKLNEQEISDRLGISRTPIREALIQLAADGLLESIPHRGFRVKPLSLKEVTELYIIIGNLDSLAANLALYNLSEEDINQMEGLKEEMDEAIKKEEYDRYYKLQIEFHDVYINKCNNKELIRILNQLRMRFIRQSYSNIDKEELLKVLLETKEQHGVIIDLIKARDSKRLENYIKEVHWNTKYAFSDVV